MMRLLFLITLMVSLFTQVLFAECILYEVPLTERVAKSSLIIEGKVLASFSFWDEPHQHIYTANRVEVYKVFKGKFVGEIYILTVGGTVDGEMEVASSLLKLKEGQTGVFMCKEGSVALPDGTLPFVAVASRQGFIQYDPVHLTATDVFHQYKNSDDVYQLMAGLTKTDYKTIKIFTLSRSQTTTFNKTNAVKVTGFTPATIPAGNGAKLTINGNGFGATRGNGNVGFRNTEDGGKTYAHPHASQYISWTNTQIIVQLPDTAGTGKVFVTNDAGSIDSSFGVLTVPYSRSTVFNGGVVKLPQLIDKEGSGGYILQMHAGFNTNAEAKNAFLKSLLAWRCSTLVNWSLGGTTTISHQANDNFNIVAFDLHKKLDDGVLGVCYSYYTSCNSDNRWHVSGYDIIFRDTTAWYFGNPATIPPLKYDFESVTLHELGHGLQIRHVISKNDLMHYALNKGVIKRTINANDKAGADEVLKLSSTNGACVYFPMQLLNTAICQDASLAFFKFDGIKLSPNPTTGGSTVSYLLENEATVKISLYSMLGQHMAVLVNEVQSIGKHVFSLNGTQYNLENGVYIIRMEMGGKTYSQKLVKI